MDDAAMGPKELRSTALSKEEEALAVAFRHHTLLPLDDCLSTLQAPIPQPTRSELHRLFQRHDIGRLPGVAGSKTKRVVADECEPVSVCWGTQDIRSLQADAIRQAQLLG